MLFAGDSGILQETGGFISSSLLVMPAFCWRRHRFSQCPDIATKISDGQRGWVAMAGGAKERQLH